MFQSVDVTTINNRSPFEFDSIETDLFWNVGTEKELKIHKVHAYPAKFPSFITTKALEYAHSVGLKVNSIADIFCGCGTTAIEAKRNKIDFWGCDINPVATLITKVKTKKFNSKKLYDYYSQIIEKHPQSKQEIEYPLVNERLKYWYKEKQFEDLFDLKRSILDATVADDDYKLFFLCAFSNILKPTSMWLTKSIKPQFDPDKKPAEVMQAFKHQFNIMIEAAQQTEELEMAPSEIVTKNFLDPNLQPPNTDLIITSPPYVTSYEYADLHQLSSLWLDFAADYRSLREGAIGSLYHEYNFNKEFKLLNGSGSKIVTLLLDRDKKKARSVAKYFLDMQKVSKKSYSILSERGMAIFVVGNTEYKGVRIENAGHLVESMFDAGFQKINISKRKISQKILTPYRDSKGKFTTDSNGRKVYNEEFIIIGRK